MPLKCRQRSDVPLLTGLLTLPLSYIDSICHFCKDTMTDICTYKVQNTKCYAAILYKGTSRLFPWTKNLTKYGSYTTQTEGRQNRILLRYHLRVYPFTISPWLATSDVIPKNRLIIGRKSIINLLVGYADAKKYIIPKHRRRKVLNIVCVCGGGEEGGQVSEYWGGGGRGGGQGGASGAKLFAGCTLIGATAPNPPIRAKYTQEK